MRLHETAMIRFTFSLPDDVVRQADAEGLLCDGVIEDLLREAVRIRKVDGLFGTMHRLAELEPLLTEDEIDVEVEAARAGRARPR